MDTSTASKRVKTYNPFLDALFNPGEKTSLKNTIHELASAHSDFSILVPPATVLHKCTDFAQQRLDSLCYTNEEFIRSHIIRTTSASAAPISPVAKQQSLIYSTMNGRQILLKNKAIFTGKGFKNSLRVRVLSVGQFAPFSPVFPDNCTFSVIYIESSLYGPQPTAESQPKDVMTLNRQSETSIQHSAITFEDLLRKFPILSKTMSASFYSLFHHNNREFQQLRTHRKLALSETKKLFDLLVIKATQIVQSSVNADSADGDRVYNLLQTLSTKPPHLDMTKLVHEYVELNMYDHIWSSLVYQYENVASGERIDDPESPKTVLTHALYRDLSCLSLNQLDIPVVDPWDLNTLHRRVAEAIKVFATLSGPNVTSQRQKIAVIKGTVSILTANSANTFSGPVIDADTLIGLLIMVIVHSKVPNLECHLFYIRHFGVSHRTEPNGHSHAEEELGFMSYILSNIDAVIFHLHDSGVKPGAGHLTEMSSSSAKNYKFWYMIQKQDLGGLEEFFDLVDSEFHGTMLPRQHVLYSRNINGESCFHLAIRTRNHHLFSMLLHRTEEWVLIEDILFDKNTTTNQNLLMTALQEEVPEMINDLIDLLLHSTTIQEQSLYLNSKDTCGRTVGHFLSNDLTALARLGGLIDWKAKDLNSHTPLFSLCRCYDHASYDEMVQIGFQIVRDLHPEGLISYDAHTDKAGNTLLHALARALPETALLRDSRNLINVNEMNHKGVSPAALYVRYSRIENLENLFRDPRLVFDLEEPKYCYNLMDYYSFSASKNSNSPNEAFSKIEKCVADKYFCEYFPSKNTVEVGFVNARFDGATSDWAINTFHHRMTPGTKVASKYVPLERIRLFYNICQSSSTMSFFPSEDEFWANFARGKPSVPICAKFKTNRMLEHLSMFFALVNYLRPDVRKQLLRIFARVCKDDPARSSELVKDLAIARGNVKNTVGDVKLSESSIQEILYFIEYSKADLMRHKIVLTKLKRASALGAIRQADMRNVTDHFYFNIKGLGSNKSDDNTEFRRIDSPYLELQKYIGWIETCTGELLSKSGQMVEKIQLWQDSYKKIKVINADMHKFEDLVVPRNTQSTPNSHDVQNGDNFASDHPCLSRRSTLSVEDLPDEEENENDTSFFKFGLIDSKKSRYKKLVLAKSDEVKKLMDLNVDIKLAHEALAAEISHFLEYRSGALRFGMRQFVNRSLVSLRSRHYELTKVLCEAKKTWVSRD